MDYWLLFDKCGAIDEVLPLLEYAAMGWSGQDDVRDEEQDENVDSCAAGRDALWVVDIWQLHFLRESSSWSIFVVRGAKIQQLHEHQESWLQALDVDFVDNWLCLYGLLHRYHICNGHSRIHQIQITKRSCQRHHQSFKTHQENQIQRGKVWQNLRWKRMHNLYVGLSKIWRRHTIKLQ